MSLVEVLPEVRTLSRHEKIRLIQFLAQELEQDDASVIPAGQSYEIWTPFDAIEAAETLQKALDEDKRKS